MLAVRTVAAAMVADQPRPRARVADRTVVVQTPAVRTVAARTPVVRLVVAMAPVARTLVVRTEVTVVDHPRPQARVAVRTTVAMAPVEALAA
jgi:hypothetical protein